MTPPRPGPPCPGPPFPGFGRALAVLFALAAALRAWLVARPLPALDGRAIPDDAYISLQIAKNIGLGLGPLYGDAYTNGFQPLYVWIMAIPAALAGPAELGTVDGLDALVKVALAVCAAFDLGTLLLVALLLRRAGFPIAALFFALAWAIYPPFLATAMNGLETGLSLFFVALVWLLAERWPLASAPPRHLALLGLAVGVGATARIDLLMVGLFFAAASLAALWRGRTAGLGALARGWLPRNLALAAGVAVGYAPWLFYSHYYTGRWYPISGEAVRFLSLAGVNRKHMRPFYEAMIERARDALRDNLPYLRWAALAAAALLVALAVVACLRRDPALAARVRAALRLLALPALFGASLLVAYTFYIFCPWYFTRYFAPISILAVATLGLAVDVSARALARRAPLLGRVVFGLAFTALAAAAIVQPKLDDLLRKGPDKRLGYRNLGIWARDKLPEGTILGAAQSGALAYYATQTLVYNLDGVVNQDAFAALKRRRLHEYIRAKKIRYLIGWDVNIWFLAHHSRGLPRREWVKRPPIRGFRSWGFPWLVYEVLTPENEELLRAELRARRAGKKKSPATKPGPDKPGPDKPRPGPGQAAAKPLGL